MSLVPFLKLLKLGILISKICVLNCYKGFFVSLSSILTEGMQYIREYFSFTKRNKLTVPEEGSSTFWLIKE